MTNNEKYSKIGKDNLFVYTVNLLIHNKFEESYKVKKNIIVSIRNYPQPIKCIVGQ